MLTSDQRWASVSLGGSPRAAISLMFCNGLAATETEGRNIGTSTAFATSRTT